MKRIVFCVLALFSLSFWPVALSHAEATRAIKRVKDLSDGRMQWTDGMLYPVLHRLEKQKLIQSRWRESKTGRRRKYYKIKKEGTKALKEQKNQWEVVYSTLRQLWKDEPCLI